MADQTTSPVPPALQQLVQAPSAAPAQGQSGPISPDLMTMFAQRLGQGDQAIQNQRDIAAKIAAVPQAPIGFHPNFGGGFLHDLGQALLAAGAATRPGQAIMNVAQEPAIARRAQTIAGLKAQMEPEEEATKFNTAAAEGAGRLGYEQGMLNYHNTANDIRKIQVETQAKAQASRAADMLVREAQGWKNLDVKEQANRIRQSFDNALLPLMQARIDAGMDENSARIQAGEDIKAALSQNQYAVQHPILSMLGISPDLGAAPGAQQPKAINAPTPVKPAKPSGKTQHLHFDAQGNQIK